jgi:hypothetical protein
MPRWTTADAEGSKPRGVAHPSDSFSIRHSSYHSANFKCHRLNTVKPFGSKKRAVLYLPSSESSDSSESLVSGHNRKKLQKKEIATVLTISYCTILLISISFAGIEV